MMLGTATGFFFDRDKVFDAKKLLLIPAGSNSFPFRRIQFAEDFRRTRGGGGGGGGALIKEQKKTFSYGKNLRGACDPTEQAPVHRQLHSCANGVGGRGTLAVTRS